MASFDFDEVPGEGYVEAEAPDDYAPGPGDADGEMPESGVTGGVPAPPAANGMLDDDFVNEAGPVLPPPSAMEPEESRLLREWRRKKAIELEEKAKASQEKHEQIVEDAKKEQEVFYDRRKQSIAQAKINNREKEKIFQSNLESLNAKKGGNYWEAVTAFVNFDTPTTKKDNKRQGKGEPQRTSTLLADAKPGKHTDMTRMRQVLLKLKHNPPVRAA